MSLVYTAASRCSPWRLLQGPVVGFPKGCQTSLLGPALMQSPMLDVETNSFGVLKPGRSSGNLQAKQVAAIAFAMTCSGPFGVEDCVRTFGATWTCIGVIVTALLWAMPQIAMTAELSTLLPLSNGGVVSWVDRAFGKSAAAMVALNMVVYQLVDLATYPSIVVAYAQDLNYGMATWIPVALSYVVILVGILFNLLHIELASNLYTWLLAFILLPFVVGLAFAAPSWRTAAMAIGGEVSATGRSNPPAFKDLNLFLSMMLWLNSGWDSMGNLAEEVRSPQSLVRGLVLAAVANPLVYIGCVFGALAAGPGPWTDGYLATAYGLLWPPLTGWIVMMASIANLLLYVSELTCLARLIQSLGDPTDGSQLLPGILGKTLGNKAPAVAVVVVSVIEALLVSGFSFQYLVQLSTLLHVFAFWLALAAFIQLRTRRGDAERLWVVPGGWLGAVAMVLVKVPVLVMLCLSACTDWALVCGAVFGNGGFLLLAAIRAQSSWPSPSCPAATKEVAVM